MANVDIYYLIQRAQSTIHWHNDPVARTKARVFLTMVEVLDLELPGWREDVANWSELISTEAEDIFFDAVLSTVKPSLDRINRAKLSSDEATQRDSTSSQ